MDRHEDHGRRDGDAMNIMELIAKSMTEKQIRAVSLYFASVRPPEVTPLDPSFVSPEDVPGSRSNRIRGPDMGAVQNPESGSTV